MAREGKRVLRANQKGQVLGVRGETLGERALIGMQKVPSELIGPLLRRKLVVAYTRSAGRVTLLIEAYGNP